MVWMIYIHIYIYASKGWVDTGSTTHREHFSSRSLSRFLAGTYARTHKLTSAQTHTSRRWVHRADLREKHRCLVQVLLFCCCLRLLGFLAAALDFLLIALDVDVSVLVFIVGWILIVTLNIQDWRLYLENEMVHKIGNSTWSQQDPSQKIRRV